VREGMGMGMGMGKNRKVGDLDLVKLECSHALKLRAVMVGFLRICLVWKVRLEGLGFR